MRIEEKLVYILENYVNDMGWWKKVEAAEAVGLPIIQSMRITDTICPNLHLACKAYEDMKTLMHATMLSHPTAISDEEGKAFERIIESRIKDCVSQGSLAAGGVKPKYVYATDDQQ